MKRKSSNGRQAGLVSAIVLGSYMCQGDQCILQPNIPLLAGAFPEYSYAAVTVLQTVSALSLGMTALLAGYLVKITGKKRLLTAGSLCFIAAGTLIGISPSYFMVLLCRIFEGAGAGIVIAVSMMLIPDFFPDTESQNKIIGLNAVVTALCGAVIGAAAGYLGTLSWRYSALLYLAGIIVLIFQILFIPSENRRTSSADDVPDSEPAGQAKLTLPAVNVGVMAFLFALFSTIFMVDIAEFIVEEGIGDSSQSGLTISVMTAGSFIAGLLFSKMLGTLKESLPVVSYIFMEAGAAVPLFLPTLPAVMISTALFGFGYGLYFPYINTRGIAISNALNKDKNVSFINGCYYIGMFFSSFLIGLADRISGDSSAAFNFKFISAAFAVFIAWYAAKEIFLKITDSSRASSLL